MKIRKILTSKNLEIATFFNMLGPMVLNGISFITMPIFTKLLGTENYGLYALFSTWVSFASIFTGLQVSGTIGTAKMHLNNNEYKGYLSSILTLATSSFTLITIICIIFMDKISAIVGLKRYLIIWIIIQSFFSFCIEFAISKYRFEKEPYKVFLISIAVAISGVLLSLVFLFKMNDESTKYLSRVYGVGIPIILIGALIYIKTLVQGRVFFSKKYWRFCLPLCLPLLLSGVSGSILSQSDRVMLQQMTNMNAVGVYSFSYSLASILTVIYSAFNGAWVPFYFEYTKANKIETIRIKTINYIELFSIITVGFVLLSPEVVKVFAPEEFWVGIDMIPILAIGMYFIFLYSFPVNFEFYHRKSSFIALGTVVSAIINIGFNLLFIPVIGIFGAALATTLSYALLFAFHYIISKYIMKNDFPYKLSIFMPGLVSVFCAVGMLYISKQLPIIRWGIGLLLGVYILRKIIKRKTIF